jgi:hypothetical protein
MTKQSEPARHEGGQQQETVTPFLERSITELIRLSGQLFTTPFAFINYNKAFREQITALAKGDLDTPYPETIARPLSFFVCMMGVHFLLSRIYFRMVLPGVKFDEVLALGPNFLLAISPLIGDANAANAAAAGNIFGRLYAVLGPTQTLVIIAFLVTLIIALKAFLVSSVGRLLQCPVRFNSALYASAYALGSLIFFQYAVFALRFLAGVSFGATGFSLSYGIVAYGTVILCMVLAVRVNQVIRQADGTDVLATYATWFFGTVAWQFVICIGVFFVARMGVAEYWRAYSEYWGVFGTAMYPPAWFSH